MNEEWLVDGRKIPDEVMGYIRKIAVQAVRENGQSPEVGSFSISRGNFIETQPQHVEK